MSRSANRDNWHSYSFQFERILEHIAREPSIQERIKYINYILEEHHSIISGFDCELHYGLEVDRANRDGLSILLGYQGDFESIESQIHNIKIKWPNYYSPILRNRLCDLDYINSVFNPSVYFKVISFHDNYADREMCQLSFFLEDIESLPLEKKIAAIDWKREITIQKIRAGNLILLDENRNLMFDPQDDDFLSQSLIYITTTLDNLKSSLLTKLYLEQSASGVNYVERKHDFNKPITWFKSLEGIKELFCLLRGRDLIELSDQEIEHAIYNHFRDKGGSPFDELGFEPEAIPPLIHWLGTQPQIIFLIEELKKQKYIFYPEGKTADVICFHFIDKKSKEFNKKDIQSVASRTDRFNQLNSSIKTMNIILNTLS